MCGKGSECSPKNFLFSNTEPWRLYSPENRYSKSVRIFYLVWRWFWALLFLATYILSIVNNIDEGSKWLIYLTNWAYTVFCLSQLINAIVATVGFASKGGVDEVRWYLKVNWFMYELSQVAAVVVTLLYWGALFDGDFSRVGVHTYFNHGINGAFVLIDIWVTAMPIKVLHFYIPASFGLAWSLFSLVYDYAGGVNGRGEPYIYSILDWTADPTMASIILVAAVAAAIVIHFVLFGLFKLRLYIYTKCCSLPPAPQNIKTANYSSVEMTER